MIQRLAVLAFLAAPVLVVSTPAEANFKTGNELFRECTASRSDATYYQSYASCTGFIIGVVDGAEMSGFIISALGEMDDDPIRMVCVPDGVEAGQVREIVVQHLRANPADRHKPASGQIISAVRAAYPCPAL